MQFNHYSVLLDETIDNLNIDPDGIYVDGTMGGGGHSREILKRLNQGKLIGFDRDMTAINVCRERLSEFGERVEFVNRNFFEIKDVLSEMGIESINGAVLDLGVSPSVYLRLCFQERITVSGTAEGYHTGMTMTKRKKSFHRVSKRLP